MFALNSYCCSVEDKADVLVDISESSATALIELTLGAEAVVLIEIVGLHASLEGAEDVGAHLLQDDLSRGRVVLTREAIR